MSPTKANKLKSRKMWMVDDPPGPAVSRGTLIF